MAERLTLHEEFCKLLGSRNVYFQTPESVNMSYPAIRYELGGKDTKRADDGLYMLTNKYEGVVIARDPDTTIPDAMLKHFKMCSLGRPYTSNNLNHYPFTLYY